MAQKRYFNFQENDSTQLLNESVLAIAEPGRYHGFDAFQDRGDMVLNLNHSITGLTYTSYPADPTDPTAVLSSSNMTSAIMSTMGVFIYEDAPIVLAISENLSADPRIDIVVMEHRYIEVTGGVSAVYKVIQGSPSATPAKPALTKPLEQVELGTLFLPANTTRINSADGVVWNPSLIPEIGALNLRALIGDVNDTITDIQNDITNIQNDITNIFGNIDTIEADILQLQTDVTCSKPVFRIQSSQLQVKYICEADTEYVNLGVPFQVTVPTLFQFVAAVSGLPTLPCLETTTPNIGKAVTLTPSINEGGLFFQNRYFYAPQTRTYTFLFCNITLEAIADFGPTFGVGNFTIVFELVKNNNTATRTTIATFTRLRADFESETADTIYSVNCQGCVVLSEALNEGDFVAIYMRVTADNASLPIANNLRVKTLSWEASPTLLS